MFCRREKERVREESADRKSLLTAGEDVRNGGEDVVDREDEPREAAAGGTDVFDMSAMD
jgi:hypothetical protein